MSSQLQRCKWSAVDGIRSMARITWTILVSFLIQSFYNRSLVRFVTLRSQSLIETKTKMLNLSCQILISVTFNLFSVAALDHQMNRIKIKKCPKQTRPSTITQMTILLHLCMKMRNAKFFKIMMELLSAILLPLLSLTVQQRYSK